MRPGRSNGLSLGGSGPTRIMDATEARQSKTVRLATKLWQQSN